MIEDLNDRIINCKECKRLVEYINYISKVKIKRYKEQEYWGKPLPGFGDINGRLLIIGLAPAAHGGNRTGRMFTGDHSGEWLIKALYLTGFANQPISISKDDGLRLKDVYVTAVVKCAPPKNRPTNEELRNCSKYLKEELSLLKNIKVVLTLGYIAFKTYTALHNLNLRFAHNKIYNIGSLILISSYHPSRHNTQTKRLTWDMWLSIFTKIRSLLENIK